MSDDYCKSALESSQQRRRRIENRSITVQKPSDRLRDGTHSLDRMSHVGLLGEALGLDAARD
jgi:hypothetical protein